MLALQRNVFVKGFMVACSFLSPPKTDGVFILNLFPGVRRPIPTSTDHPDESENAFGGRKTSAAASMPFCTGRSATPVQS